MLDLSLPILTTSTGVAGQLVILILAAVVGGYLAVLLRAPLVVGYIVGGLIVGIVQVMSGTYLAGVSVLGTGFSAVVPWLLMMAVLLVKPYGIFGTEEIRRV